METNISTVTITINILSNTNNENTQIHHNHNTTSQSTQKVIRQNYFKKSNNKFNSQIPKQS